MPNNLFPGDDICENEGFIRGHGTSVSDQRIKSTYFGKLQQINKLLTVIPNFSFKYYPEIGDIVIGRVTEIYSKKWRIDTNSKTETSLALSAINLPGVVQRRKIESDEIEMRNIFGLGDLLVCEVQKVSKNGNGALHTRSEKYGRLKNGILIQIPSMYLVSPKTKFISKEGISLIVAANGYIWISGDCPLKIAKMHSEIKKLVKHCFKVDIESIFEQI